MKKIFIKKLLFLFIIIFFLMTIINIAYNKKVIPYSKLSRAEIMFNKFIDQQASTSKNGILIFGDSHPQKSINPKFLNNSFNFASSGENYTQTYYKLRYAIENNNLDIKSVLLPLDLHSFSSIGTNKNVNSWYWNKSFDSKEIYTFFGLTYFLKFKILAYFPVIGRGQSLVSFTISPPPPSTIIKGYVPVHKVFNKEKDGNVIAIDRARQHFFSANVLDPKLLMFFDNTLRLLSKKGIKVYLVKYPVTDLYYNKASRYIGNMNSFEYKVNSIVSKYNNVDILDYHNLFFSNYDMFSDSDHLNIKGAEIFTKILSEKLAQVK